MADAVLVSAGVLDHRIGKESESPAGNTNIVKQSMIEAARPAEGAGLPPGALDIVAGPTKASRGGWRNGVKAIDRYPRAKSVRATQATKSGTPCDVVMRS